MRASRQCARCNEPMRPQKSSGQPELRTHASHGLCTRCWSYARDHDQLADYPPSQRSRDDLLDDYVVLRSEGHDWRACAVRLGMTLTAFRRAMERARADGDPRAGRIGERWPVAP